ncbi:alpha/beta hydrolase [Amycolatopsis aidingensis]|uniref:alpha/beta hydrolase n=1 Tax=Amycolatopsis aidingensis TaxID=2842453 RepID=UPI001C0ADBEF|nr:alpha/beta fold hydrolase [Amycolatopsis aidingensis]
MTAQPTFVFVHGTNANAHHWSWIVQELALLGHRGLAVDLPGHGLDAYIPVSYLAQDEAGMAVEPSPLGKLTVEDYVHHVEHVVRRAHAHGPVILVGHSQGGVSLNLVGNRIPDLIHHLVYISAFCCIDRPSPNDYVADPQLRSLELEEFMALGFGTDPNGLGVSRINWNSPDPRAQAAFKELNAHTYTDAESRAMHQLLQPDEPNSIPASDARGEALTWGRVPRTYIRLSEDRFLTPAMQDQWIAEADRLTPDNRFEVHTVDSPHFLPRDQKLVSILDELGRRP